MTKTGDNRLATNASKAQKPSLRHPQDEIENRTGAAFEEAEREGLMLAAKVRMIALSFVLLIVVQDRLEPWMAYVYGISEAVVFILLGLLQYLSARFRFHVHTLKYVFVIIDCAFLAFVIGSSNPFLSPQIPAAIAMNGSRASYFLILLLQSAFTLRPALVLWCGFCIGSARIGMFIWFAIQPEIMTDLSLPDDNLDTLLAAWPNTDIIFFNLLMLELITITILSIGLAFMARRYRRLVASRILTERKRSSLSRYFSPNVVDHLTAADRPFDTIREQDVAVLFADIVGFTKQCENAAPKTIITLLREYHNKLGEAVFKNGGTLDKYIGDGLMATFGTPDPHPADPQNALKCALDMIVALEKWNAERVAVGDSPVQVGIGIHFGPVVAGDIGNEHRLEYGVIGDTVNTASRLEHLTRKLGTSLVVSDQLVRAIQKNDSNAEEILQDLVDGGVHQVRGRAAGVPVRILRTTDIGC